MKISIVTVSYNSEATIGDTIASVAAQDHADFEHIIVDGASKDGTLRVVEALAHDRLRVASQPDAGLYDAMNRGLQRATGDLVGFLNSDDFYCRTDALTLLANAAAATDRSAVAASVAIVDKDRPERMLRRYPAVGFRPWMLRLTYMPPHPGFYVRRADAQRVGLFNLDLRVAADFDWMTRFFLVEGLSAHLIPETLVSMRAGGSSQQISGMHRSRRESVQSLRAHGHAPPLPLAWAKYVMKAPQLLASGSRLPVPDQVRWTSARA